MGYTAPGGSHREYHAIRVYLYIEQVSSAVVEHTSYGRVEFFAGGDPFAGYAVSCRHARKIGIQHWGFGVAMVEEQVLPLFYHTQEIIIENNDLHIDTILHDCTQFFDCHLQSSVSGKKADRAVGIAYLGSDSGGKAEPHSAQSAGGNDTAGSFEPVISGR